MSLEKFFSTRRRFPLVPDGRAETVGEFFDRCQPNIVHDGKVIKAWHELLSAFVDDVRNRLLIRLYESVSNNGRLETRRGAITRMSNGFEFAFASNYFARVIYTMAYFGYVPKLNDFKNMINNRLVSISYPRRTTSSEQNIAAYNSRIKDAQYNTRDCYTPGWYLAHIVGVNSTSFHGYNGRLSDFISAGASEDWKLDNNRMVVRLINRDFSSLEFKVLRAHCLRFLDPINYFLVPSRTYERHVLGRSHIGEDENVVAYAKEKIRQLVGDDTYDDFCRRALVPVVESSKINDCSRKVIRIEFSSKLNRGINVDNSDGRERQVGHGLSAMQISLEDRLAILKAYLVDGMSYRIIERDILGVEFKKRGGGFYARGILQEFGVTGKQKGELSHDKDWERKLRERFFGKKA